MLCRHVNESTSHLTKPSASSQRQAYPQSSRGHHHRQSGATSSESTCFLTCSSWTDSEYRLPMQSTSSKELLVFISLIVRRRYSARSIRSGGCFRGVLWFTRFPFVLLGAVGFDAGRAEGSVFGKFFKAIFALVSATAAVLTILNYLG